MAARIDWKYALYRWIMGGVLFGMMLCTQCWAPTWYQKPSYNNTDQTDTNNNSNTLYDRTPHFLTQGFEPTDHISILHYYTIPTATDGRAVIPLVYRSDSSLNRADGDFTNYSVDTDENEEELHLDALLGHSDEEEVQSEEVSQANLDEETKEALPLQFEFFQHAPAQIPTYLGTEASGNHLFFDWDSINQEGVLKTYSVGGNLLSKEIKSPHPLTAYDLPAVYPPGFYPTLYYSAPFVPYYESTDSVTMPNVEVSLESFVENILQDIQSTEQNWLTWAMPRRFVYQVGDDLYIPIHLPVNFQTKQQTNQTSPANLVSFAQLIIHNLETNTTRVLRLDEGVETFLPFNYYPDSRDPAFHIDYMYRFVGVDSKGRIYLQEASGERLIERNYYPMFGDTLYCIDLESRSVYRIRHLFYDTYKEYGEWRYRKDFQLVDYYIRASDDHIFSMYFHRAHGYIQYVKPLWDRPQLRFTLDASEFDPYKLQADQTVIEQTTPLNTSVVPAESESRNTRFTHTLGTAQLLVEAGLFERPSPSSEQLASLNKGEVVWLLNREKGNPDKLKGYHTYAYPWYWVQRDSGEQGWVFGGMLIPLDATISEKLAGTYTTKGTAYPVQFTLRKDQTFTFKLHRRGCLCGKYKYINNQLHLYDIHPEKKVRFPEANAYEDDTEEIVKQTGDPLYEEMYRNGFTHRYYVGYYRSETPVYGPEITIPIDEFEDKTVLVKSLSYGNLRTLLFVKDSH
jgi:hypothetical protein